MQHGTTSAVTVRVRLLPDPPLWCWEIVDPNGVVVESSWSRDWSAYRSAGEALREGAGRLGLGAQSAVAASFFRACATGALPASSPPARAAS